MSLNDLPQYADSADDVLDILDAIAFAPLKIKVWRVTPIYEPPHGYLIAPIHERADRDTGIVGPGEGRAFHVAQGAPRLAVVRTAWLALKTLLDHEALEGFLVAGVRLFDPHAPNIAGG